MKLSDYIQAATLQVRQFSNSSDMSAVPVSIEVNLNSTGLVCQPGEDVAVTVTVNLQGIQPDP